jgi:hypothetical protein
MVKTQVGFKEFLRVAVRHAMYDVMRIDVTMLYGPKYKLR